MRNPSGKLLAVFLFLVGGLAAIRVAFVRPGYFSNPALLGALIFLQVLAVTLWKYRERFFLVLILTFLAAGTAVPLHDVWTSARWFVLAAGAALGFVLQIKTQDHPFGMFHLLALACVLAAVASALASSHPEMALLKALSLFLLFLYGTAGARLAVRGREQRFFTALLLGCEVLVFATAVSYFVLRIEFFGNRNSLGAAMGVVALPILLWGYMVDDLNPARWPRSVALVLCLLLLLFSYERAGIMAAAVSSSVLCLGLRRYRLLFAGMGVALLLAAVVAAFVPPPDAAQSAGNGSLTSRFVYKGKREGGLLGSRKTIWQQTVSTLQEHPWFGTGFGTSATTYENSGMSDKFSSSDARQEHGNSYLEIAEWMGLLGSAPFALLLLLAVIDVGQVFAWMRRTDSACSPAVPVAAFIAGALVNAAFEDWLFAVGYYVCVFFWALAFMLPDLLPRQQANRFTYTSLAYAAPVARSELGGTATAQ